MSATLTWYSAGPQTKTGTTVATLIDDLVSLIASQSANADFEWETASSNNASTPYYWVGKRKNGSAGRILLVVWTSAPAGNNSAILDMTPSSNTIQLCWFPAGNVDTPSNLTASSGTILGNDSGAVKCTSMNSVASAYQTGNAWSALSNSESLLLNIQNPAGGTMFWGWAGDILVDAADNAYGGCMGSGVGGGAYAYIVGAATPSGWTIGNQNAGAQSGSSLVRTNYGQANSVWGYPLVSASNSFTNQNNGSGNDPLVDSATQNVYFLAIPLAAYGGYTPKGLPLKLRQLAIGPLNMGLWPVWNSSGPVVQARGINAVNTDRQSLWCTNFQI